MNLSTQRKSSEFNRFILADLDGNTVEVSDANFKKCALFHPKSSPYQLLRMFVANELGRSKRQQGLPKHIEYMRKHDLLDYCDVSEKGHFKWLPKGLLLQKLLLAYAEKLAREWGAFEMKNPMIIRGSHNVVGELMGEFHERDYRVDGGRGVCYLRYASDPLAFPFMQKIQFNRRQSPLKVYEEASCFRNEQQGEVSGLKRVRNFLMTDMHAACSSIDEARQEFEQLCYMFAGLMDGIIASKRWVLGWEGTEKFFHDNKHWLINIGKKIGVPAFFKLMPEMSHYYAIKNEFQAITADNANIQISTVQWDVKDGERFNIGYIDDAGKKHPCPVIIHASSFGSIERTLCAILENIAFDEANGKIPAFPLWLAPTQVRIIPVSVKHLSLAEKICERISKKPIRVDIDDMNDTVGKKIRRAAQEWIPYVSVIGDKEAGSQKLAVRERGNDNQQNLTIDELSRQIVSKTNDLPFRPLPLPQFISLRPIFT